MKFLELFAGSCSVSKAGHELGYESFSSDIIDFPSVDYVCDILDFDTDKAPLK